LDAVYKKAYVTSPVLLTLNGLLAGCATDTVIAVDDIDAGVPAGPTVTTDVVVLFSK
jgi:hypothetical protein